MGRRNKYEFTTVGSRGTSVIDLSHFHFGFERRKNPVHQVRQSVRRERPAEEEEEEEEEEEDCVLCEALAAATRRLCTSFVDPTIIRPFIACRLIALSKNPGIRPIGICDTLRRIIGKAILNVIGAAIQAVAGSSQLCARQRSGCEAASAVHAIIELFNNEQVKGLLLVDAHNAFNSLNRAVVLQNIQVTCPSLAAPVINMYRSDAELFVGEETIFSQEGTTQGVPLSMAVYALSTLPLISQLSQPNFTQTLRKLGLPMMLAEEHLSRSFTNGGLLCQKWAQDTGVTLTGQKPGYS